LLCGNVFMHFGKDTSALRRVIIKKMINENARNARVTSWRFRKFKYDGGRIIITIIVQTTAGVLVT